jgi:hypothetical protein
MHKGTGTKMSRRRVKLVLENGQFTYITSTDARRLRKTNVAFMVSEAPYVLMVREKVQCWGAKSDGSFVMSGAAMMRRLPLLGVRNEKGATNETE